MRGYTTDLVRYLIHALVKEQPVAVALGLVNAMVLTMILAGNLQAEVRLPVDAMCLAIIASALWRVDRRVLDSFRRDGSDGSGQLPSSAGEGGTEKPVAPDCNKPEDTLLVPVKRTRRLGRRSKKAALEPKDADAD